MSSRIRELIKTAEDCGYDVTFETVHDVHSLVIVSNNAMYAAVSISLKNPDLKDCFKKPVWIVDWEEKQGLVFPLEGIASRKL